MSLFLKFPFSTIILSCLSVEPSFRAIIAFIIVVASLIIFKLLKLCDIIFSLESKVLFWIIIFLEFYFILLDMFYTTFIKYLLKLLAINLLIKGILINE